MSLDYEDKLLLQSTHDLAESTHKILTGGNEPSKGLIYQHQDTRSRVASLERSEKKNSRWTFGAVMAAITAVVHTLWMKISGD